MELQTVLCRHIVVRISIYKSVLLSEVSLERQGCLALVKYVLYTVAHHILEALCNIGPAHVHAYAVGLHHRSLSIYVYHQPRQAISFAMHESVCIVLRVVRHPDSYSQSECRLQLSLPKCRIYRVVIERQHPHGDRADLVVSHCNELTFVGKNPYRLALLDFF